MPIHPSYRAYSPDLGNGIHIPDSHGTDFKKYAYVLESPSTTLHLYEQRPLPSLPSPSVTQTILDEIEAIETDSDYSDDVDPPRPRTPLHVVDCQKQTPEKDADLSSQLSLVPLPLHTGRQANPPLTPPISKYARSSQPYDIVAADVPQGASMELEKHHSSWSVAIYSPSNTVALFRLPINRKRSSLRQQTTKTMSRVAMICAGLSDPVKITVTGYLDQPSELPPYQLPNSLWTCKVFALCQKIGHKPALSLHDSGIAGLYNCCHAEKQAVAYLHYKHPKLRKATIHLSDDPCSDCARFLRRYQMKSRKEIEIVVYGWKWQDQTVGRHFGTTLRTVL